LHAARHALAINNRVSATDRPELLPASMQGVCWKINNSAEIALIDKALREAGEGGADE
jgi:hypothetical protein